MASELIQFRLSGPELEALKAIAQEGESKNLAAQRLLQVQRLLAGLGPPRSARADSRLLRYRIARARQRRCGGRPDQRRSGNLAVGREAG